MESPLPGIKLGAGRVQRHSLGPEKDQSQRALEKGLARRPVVRPLLVEGWRETDDKRPVLHRPSNENTTKGAKHLVGHAPA